MPVRKSDENLSMPAGLPRNLLVPYVLLFLRNVSAHGYQILQTLALIGFGTLNPGTFYHTLRQMEREGLVLSGWDTAAGGPARRTYQITPNGEQFLAQWAEALGSYQKFLDRFFAAYTGAVPPTFGAPTLEDADPSAESDRSEQNGRQRPTGS